MERALEVNRESLRLLAEFKQTAEALYRMWAAGVDTVVWFRIRDEPLRTSFYQSGLYFSSWKPKRTPSGHARAASGSSSGQA